MQENLNAFQLPAIFQLLAKDPPHPMSEQEEPEKPERLQQQVAIFNNIAKAMTSSLGLNSILQIIMDGMAEFFRPSIWSLLRVDEQKNELYFVITDGETPEPIKKTRLKIGEGIAGWVAKHGESLIVPDVYSDPRFANRLDEMAKWKTKSIFCLPLQTRHRVLGVIQLINCAEESLGEQEMYFLHALCDYAAIAIDYRRE
jgi:GAF domain-containing protein